MELLLILAVVLAAIGVAAFASRSGRKREARRLEAELAPVRKLAFEDVTAFGEELQRLDAELAGAVLDEGARADYQRALDTYEAAKAAGDALTRPEDIRHVTQIVEDGRYAVACVRARAAGQPLPTRRPPCFFDPRHGLSVTDVLWAPPGGSPRDVPACALDAERVQAGAEPDVRQVMVGPRRVPYFQGGPAYQPYAAGYFASYAAMDWMVMGLAFGAFGGFDMLGEIGEGVGGAIESVGEGFGDMLGGVGEGFDGFDGFDGGFDL